jgi:hypothetical protein
LPSSGDASADAIKIIPTRDARWPYLGVYHHSDQHGSFATELAASADLKAWHPIRTIGTAASMPDLRLLYDNSLLIAQERNPSGKRPFIELQYYDQLRGFAKSDPPSQTMALPLTPGASADGTPNFGRIHYNGDVRTSTIEISHHYFAGSVNDQNAEGILTGFSQWRNYWNLELNSEMKQLGYNQVGDREVFEVGSTLYELVEARPSNKASWDTWRIFLVNRCTGRIVKLAPALSGGARSIGNPRISFITLPTGEAAIATSYFIFSEGAGTTPAGSHLQISILSGSHGVASAGSFGK